MDIQFFSGFKSHYQAQDPYTSISEDLPSFDDAFDTSSLKNFFRQQSQPSHLTVCTKFSPLFAKAKSSEFIFDEASSPSVDDRETQASPLTRYINKYSQGCSLTNSPLGVNLNYRFYADNDLSHNTHNESLQDISREPVESYYAKSLGDLSTKQSRIKLQECRMATSMLESNLNLYLAKTAQSSLVTYRKDTQSTDDSETDRSPTIFEKLLRTKKIFKIQRDARPMVSLKQKVSSQKTKTVKAKTAKTSPLKTTKAEIPDITPVATHERSPIQAGPAPVMNFLHVMQEKGYTPEQVMTEIQKLMVQPAGFEQFSPIKKN